ncbi:Lactonase, 7-bladed beta-propeller-domain-containing protein [Infundibulicybe gibba]|nr:Lactonase, 7-bladed beta-propeller-domain-containing protein [Infundibulicybe gibba]
MVKYTILAGGFTQFIASYLFDSSSNTLTLVKQNPTGENPSWIASHPKNTSILYAVNEKSPIGNLQSFIVGAGGGLTLVDTVSSDGDSPTYTAMLSSGEITGMNYGSPNCAIVPTLPGDPLRFKKDTTNVEFPVNGGPSNPHMSLEYKGEVFVPDLGADKIWRLKKGSNGQFSVQGHIKAESGSGPRHIAISDNVLFTITEKTSTLTAQRIPQQPDCPALPLLASASIVPPNPPTGSKFAAAEILISTPSNKFPTPLIYVSNRNIGTAKDPRGDTIAIYEFQGGINSDPSTQEGKRMVRRAAPKFKLLAQVYTGLTQIRSMSLGRAVDGGDEFLIAGGNAAGGVAVFKRVNGGRASSLWHATRSYRAGRVSCLFKYLYFRV